MLKFDGKHQSVSGNVNKKSGSRAVKAVLISGLLVTNILLFSGLHKEATCDITENHAHYYINNQEAFGRYIASEKLSVSGLKRTDNYIYVSPEEIGLLNFMNKEGLFSITDNQDAIRNIVDKQHDYIEYRYKYMFFQPIPVIHTSGKHTRITYNYIPRPRYSWTTDTSKNLTGEERTCHYVYYGYKIVKNDKNGYELVKSEPVDNLDDLPAGFDYIKEDFYSIVNSKKETLDYEDGPEEDEIINAEEYQEETNRGSR